MTIRERAARLGLPALAGAALLLFGIRGAWAFESGENANLVLGQSNFTTNASATSQTGLYNASRLTFDSSGNLWVTDFNNNRVLRYAPPFFNGEPASMVLGQLGASYTSNTQAVSATGMYAPAGLAFDSSGNLWVADSGNDRVLEFQAPLSNSEAASLVIGYSSFNVSGLQPTSASAMNQPGAIAFDYFGNLWVMDTGNSRILEFKPPFSNGMSASLVLGQSTFTTSVEAVTQSGAAGPNGLVFDSTGPTADLWVTDAYNNRVLEFTPPSFTVNGSSAALVLGQPDFISSAPAAGASGMHQPTGMKFDASGNLWIADFLNNRVLKFSPPFSNGMSASLILGQSNFTSSAAATTQNGMNSPTGIAIDSAGSLWVAEDYNNRITRFAGSMPSGCAYGYNVKQDGSQNFTSIQAAVNALPATLAGPTCVVIQDAGPYDESVTVSGFTNNGSSLTIMAAPADSSPPIVSPPAASGFAFDIAQASVTIKGLKIVPNYSLPSGIAVSGPDVVIDSVSVVDASGYISSAAISLSGFDTVLNSTVSVQSAAGLILNGQDNAVSGAVVTSNGTGNAALSLYGPSDTILRSSIWNQTGTGADLYAGSSGDTIGQSVIQGGGYATRLENGASQNSIIGSTVASSGNDALLLLGASSTTVSGSYLSSPVITAYIVGSTGTAISGSTLIDGAGTSAVFVSAQSSNVFLSNDALSGGTSGDVHLNVGNSGILALSSDAISGANYGLDISSQAPAAVLSVSSLTFASLLPGATAINFLSGVFDSTFSGMNFADGSVATNVNALTLNSPSSIVMAGSSGPRTGPGYADDPNHVIVWPNLPLSAVTYPANNADLNNLLTISGTAASTDSSTITSVSIEIEQLSTGKWWNGSAWAATQTVSTATFVGVDSGTWSWPVGSLPAALQSGVSYKIVSQATDSAGQTQYPAANSNFTFDNTPPTSGVGVPANGSMLPALPSISGTAADGVGVAIASLSLNVQDLNTSYCYNPGSGFNASCPNFFPASISTGVWSYGGIAWTAGHQYLIVSSATDAAGNVQNLFPVGISSNTFTFNGLSTGNLGDGQGSASISPAAAPGCQVLTATITYVAATPGLQQGGMIAVNIPPGWSNLQGEDAGNDPPLNPGYVHVVSTITYGMQFNPSQIGNTVLGPNWMVYTASAALAAGATVQFVYKGYPAGGPTAQGQQVFAVQVQGGPGGNLRPIAGLLPAINLAPGLAANLVFVPNSPLALGALQNSPTMYLALTDACGVSTTAASAVTATLSGNVNGAPDLSASFSPGYQVTIPPGVSQSSGFQFMTSTSAAYENLVASASVMGANAYAYRPVQILASSVSISGVSVDTGTVGSSASATITQNSPAGGIAFINFSLSNPALGWEVVISSSSGSFSPKVADFFGSGNPGRTVAWNGLNDMVQPNSFVSSGTYYVEIIAGGGAAVNTALSISVGAGASIFGTVTNGAGASIAVMGPNVGPGNFAAADANGNFVIPGLQSGGIYNVQVSSTLLVSGAPINITTGTSNIVAAAAGTNIGSLTLPVPSYIEVSASLPAAAPSEIWGNVSAHDASYSNTANAVLHFAQGSAQSDNGAQNFGVTASTWTKLFLPPGTYEVDVNLPSINVSTRVLNVSLLSGSVQLPLTLSKQADVYGYAILPAAASTGTPVSVQAFPSGSSSGQGGIFSGTFIPPGSSSGIYSLFGLSPGSWTVTAQSLGYVGVSSSVFISSDADVGSPLNGGFDLTLQTGGIIFGTMTVTGDTSQESASMTCGAPGSGFCVQIGAYGPAAVSGQGILVHLATSTTQTSSTFTISGLPDGAYFLKSSLPGFIGGVQNAVVSGGSGGANLVMNPANDGLAVTVMLPGGGNSSDVSLGYFDIQGDSRSFDDITKIPGVALSMSSATAVFSGLNPGLYSVDAFDKANGIFQQIPAAVSAATTTVVVINMSEPAYSVRGSLSFTGALNVPEPGGLSMMVSSATGWVSQVSTVAYCVMGSSAGVTLSAAQMQLLPAAPNNGGFYGGTLFSPPHCSDMMTGGSNNQGNSNPFHVYLATIDADGTFSFSGIPPGLYQLRNNSQMDSSGDSVPQFSQVLLVTGSVSGISFPIGSGYSISGNVLAPAQTSLSRQVFLRLADQNNNQIGQPLMISFNNSASASFLFSQVPPGNYLIQPMDGGYPQAYAAAPLAVQINGQNVSGQVIQLSPSGTIKFKIALEQKTPAGGQQFIRVTQNNANLLPSSFQIQAVADPWFNGGYGFAQSQGGLLVLDSSGQGTISGLLPGAYDVNMALQNGPSVGGAGLVASSISGVKVTGGAVTDVGTINALLGDQISGRITDGSGNPLPNINLVARISQRSAGVQFQEISAATDGNGYYALNGLDPNVRYYDIYAAYRGDEEHQGEFLPPYEEQADQSVDVSSVTSLNFSLARAAYSISGRALAPSGGPSLIIPFNNGGNNGAQVSQPGAAVFLQKVGVPPTRTPLGDIQFDTDLDGNFSVPSLATGTYRMTIVSQGYSSFQENVLISTASVDVGAITLSQGPALSGTLTTASGGSPSTSQIQTLVAATPNLSSVLVGSLQSNSQAQTVSGYSVSGFQIGTAYEILLLDSNGNMVTPDEGRNIVFSSTAPMTLNMVYRPSPPLVMAKDFRQGNGFDIEFDLSQPLREQTAADDEPNLILSTVSAQGTLSDEAISQDRTEVTAFYTPGVSESSFTLRLRGYSNVTNPSSLDQNNPQFIAGSTVTFYVGIGGLSQSNIQNYIGGDVIAQGESGRVTLPANAFNVSVASSVQITLQLAEEALNSSNPSVSALSSPGAARIESLSRSPASYPSELLDAVAAVPPSVNPLSSFYNIFLPLGISTLLSSPAQLTIAYSTSVTDPSSLNVYWYNALANAYVLQQDVTGSPPVIDTVNHTITINVNHFSTYVLFNSNQSLISGAAGATDFSAHNFPNPFDLTEKTVNPQHTSGSCGSQCTIRGTMIAISIPPGMSGAASIDIFNVVGTKVRHIDLGDVSGGNYYYQNWDGTNDDGRDVASGVYFGELRVGGQRTFFKMAVIKGSGL